MFTNPHHNLERFKLKKGEYVADIGCGSGGYALAAAERVHPDGKVYAIDIRKSLPAQVKREAGRRELFNVEALWGNAEEDGGTRLTDASVDVAIASNLLFEAEDKESTVREISRILKNGGRALVIDWADSFGGLGPPGKSVVDINEAKKLFENSGFIIEDEFETGTHHYGIIVKKP